LKKLYDSVKFVKNLHSICSKSRCCRSLYQIKTISCFKLIKKIYILYLAIVKFLIWIKCWWDYNQLEKIHTEDVTKVQKHRCISTWSTVAYLYIHSYLNEANIDTPKMNWYRSHIKIKKIKLHTYLYL